MSPSVTVSASNSCNGWRCCWKTESVTECKPLPAPEPQRMAAETNLVEITVTPPPRSQTRRGEDDSGSETTSKTVTVYHRWHHKENK